MTATVILNPYSGRWQAQERRSEAEAAMAASGLEVEWAVSDGPGHASDLAAAAVRAGRRPIIAAGGDGTIGEVLNGMAIAQPEGTLGPFGLLPLGTANDLADNIGIPKDLAQAAAVIASGRSRKMDLIQVNQRIFANNAGLGLEPYITNLQAQMKRLRGNIRYLASALQGIMHNPQWHMSLEWAEGGYEGPVTMISIGNCARTGGIFYTVPHADPFDGKLTFIHGYLASRLKILRALPMTMKPAEGNITEHPAVREIHTTWLRVRVQTPSPAHADGELFPEPLQDIEYRILPKKLDILMP